MNWARKVGVDDVMVIAGASAIVYGVAHWSVPAAWVLGGVMLVAVAIGSAALRRTR